MNILFICSRNKWRSRTAETIFNNNGKHAIRSAGTENSARIKLNQKMLDWADLIFLMEKKHANRMHQKFVVDASKKEIIILDIPDDYEYMDEELVEILEESVLPYFELK